MANHSIDSIRYLFEGMREMNAQQFLEKHKAELGWVLIARSINEDPYPRVFLVDRLGYKYSLTMCGFTLAKVDPVFYQPISLWKPGEFWNADRWMPKAIGARTPYHVDPRWTLVAEYKEEETYKQIAQKQAEEIKKLRDEKEKAERNADYYKTEMEREQRLNAHDDCQAEISRLRGKLESIGMILK